MQTERSAVNQLVIKALQEGLTPEEQPELDAWLLDKGNKALFDNLKDDKKLLAELMLIHRYQLQMPEAKKQMHRLIAREGKFFNIHRLSWLRYAAAAVVGTLMVIGAFFWFNVKDNRTELAETEKSQIPADIPPGQNGAILTLASGEKVVLDSATNGLLTQQGNSNVVKSGGALIYSPSTGGSQEVAVYNTLTTPRARQFQLELPDGSKIWLNAASSVTYPNVFLGKDRKIEITGEAYLEVKKDPSKPFIVSVGGSELEVLGTSFNVNSYPEEKNTKTTLVEGRVLVRKGAKSVILTLGQQAIVKDEEVTKIENADVETAIAWKNGLIAFDQTDIRVLLRSISRWYGVEIETKGDISVPTFNGKIPRTLNLSQVLDGIHMNSGLKFVREGNKILVYK